MQLSLPLKALRTCFKKVQADSLSTDYKKWRQRFLLERLHLAAWLALIAFPTFFFLSLFVASALNATGDPDTAVSQERILWLLLDSIAT